MALTIATEVVPEGLRVAVAGEVDVSCADELREVLAAAVAEDAGRVEVDLAEVPYIDSTGIGVLVGAAHKAADAGGSLAVTHPQRGVARVLGLLGVDRELGVGAAGGAAEDAAD